MITINCIKIGLFVREVVPKFLCFSLTVLSLGNSLLTALKIITTWNKGLDLSPKNRFPTLHLYSYCRQGQMGREGGEARRWGLLMTLVTLERPSLCVGGGRGIFGGYIVRGHTMMQPLYICYYFRAPQ